MGYGFLRETVRPRVVPGFMGLAGKSRRRESQADRIGKERVPGARLIEHQVPGIPCASRKRFKSRRRLGAEFCKPAITALVLPLTCFVVQARADAQVKGTRYVLDLTRASSSFNAKEDTINSVQKPDVIAARRSPSPEFIIVAFSQPVSFRASHAI